MESLKAEIPKLLGVKISTIGIKNIYKPLINFTITIILLLICIIIFGMIIILKNNTIIIVIYMMSIIFISFLIIISLLIVSIVAYFIILNKDPDLLHDEQHILERERQEQEAKREMMKFMKENSNKSEPSNYGEINN